MIKRRFSSIVIPFIRYIYIFNTLDSINHNTQCGSAVKTSGAHFTDYLLRTVTPQ